MSTLLEQVEAMLQAIIDKRVDVNTIELRAQLIRTRRELEDTRLYANKVADERDAARAELAGVAAQRDAHLPRSVELATKLQKAHEDLELESAARRMLFTLSEDEIARLRALITRDDEVGKENAKLAMCNAELEARLAALTPAVVDASDLADRVAAAVRKERLDIVSMINHSMSADTFPMRELKRRIQERGQS